MADVNTWYRRFQAVKMRADWKQDLNSSVHLSPCNSVRFAWMAASWWWASLSEFGGLVFGIWLNRGQRLYKRLKGFPKWKEYTLEASVMMTQSRSFCSPHNIQCWFIVPAPEQHPLRSTPTALHLQVHSVLRTPHHLFHDFVFSAFDCLSQPTGECQGTWIRAISGSDCALITLDIFPQFSLVFNITFVPLLYLQLPLTRRWKIVAQHFISTSTSWLSIRDQLTAELQSSYWAVSNRSSGSVRLTSITILDGKAGEEIFFLRCLQVLEDKNTVMWSNVLHRV